MFKRHQHTFTTLAPGLLCCVTCGKRQKLQAVPITEPVEEEAQKAARKDIEQKAAVLAASTVQY